MGTAWRLNKVMRWLVKSPAVKTMLIGCGILFSVYLLSGFVPLPQLKEGGKGTNTASAVFDFLEEPPTPLTEAYARPLFHGSRRPPEERVAPEVVPVAPRRREERFTLELVGMMGTVESGRTVFILDSATGETITSRTGEVVKGWLIESIEADSVVLTKAEDTKTLVNGAGG